MIGSRYNSIPEKSLKTATNPWCPVHPLGWQQDKAANNRPETKHEHGFENVGCWKMKGHQVIIPWQWWLAGTSDYDAYYYV